MELEAPRSRLALTMTPGIAARLSARLLREFGSPEGVFRASLTALRAVGAKLVNWKEPEYPQSLLQIYDPPVLLYVQGDAQILNVPTISIVGTRRPTAYGTQMAERLARELAKRGLVIVSGLARGVDALAHQGTMAVGGAGRSA
jgi:DNA processing protein